MINIIVIINLLNVAVMGEKDKLWLEIISDVEKLFSKMERGYKPDYSDIILKIHIVKNYEHLVR